MSLDVITVPGAELSTRGEAVTILSETECWRLLGSVTLGRIVTTVDNEANIFPVNFAVQDRTVLFRTAEGTKLISAAINRRVLFEVDDHNAAEGWSVIVQGSRRPCARKRRSKEPSGRNYCRGRRWRNRIGCG